MKQYLYITLLLLSCWGVSAQNRVEALTNQSYGLVYYNNMNPNPFWSLNSSNGKYSLTYEIKELGGYDGWDFTWFLKNNSTNEIILKSKKVHQPYFGDFNVLGLTFNTSYSFKLENCTSDISDTKCIIEYFKEYSPLIATPYISILGYYCSRKTYLSCMEMTTVTLDNLFGIENANLNEWKYNTNPELASSMVYQDRGDGWYTVPEYYHAKALILTDEGDLQIVNTKEQVIWSLKQSQQEDKNFIAKGNSDPIKTASLIHTPEGHIELSNSKYQQEFDLTFLAKDYVLLSASNNKASELSVTSPNSMISMQVYQDSPTTSTAKNGLAAKSTTAKISTTEAPKLLSIPDQKNGIRNIVKKETKKTAKTVKIEKPMPTNTLTVFPNPVKDIINIVFDDAVETLTKLQILSLDGRVVKEFTGSQTPNIQELSSGMYLYLIESTKNKYDGKIIKQ